MEYYSTIKRHELLKHATTWMNHKNIMLSEKSQTQKITYCVSIYFTYLEKAKLQRQTAEQ